MNSIYLESEYVVISCGADGCDQTFAVTRRFYNWTHEGHGWFCPRGHSRRWAGETMQQKLERAEARLTSTQDQLRAAVQDGEQVRRALLRDRHRFANGVCPCCNRSFEALARHMQTQHPDYDITKIRTERDTKVRYRCSCGFSSKTPHGLAVHQGRSRGENWDAPGTSRWSAHLTKVDV